MDSSNVYDAGTNADGYSTGGLGGDADEDWNAVDALGRNAPACANILSSRRVWPSLAAGSG
ncbi:hypothetical protein [Acidocella sp. MX-AZ03]|uniref:hypothetical protein n=1 Tax=Acidocella sp. MX-AZ03 TaxID=2697363 RepID=UPI003FA47634